MATFFNLLRWKLELNRYNTTCQALVSHSLPYQGLPRNCEPCGPVYGTCLECLCSTLAFVSRSIPFSTHVNHGNQENLIFDIISYFWLYSHYLALTTNEVFLVLMMIALSQKQLLLTLLLFPLLVPPSNHLASTDQVLRALDAS